MLQMLRMAPFLTIFVFVLFCKRDFAVGAVNRTNGGGHSKTILHSAVLDSHVKCLPRHRLLRTV